MNRVPLHCRSALPALLFVCGILCLPGLAGAVAPPPQQLLPEETLAMVTAPDFETLAEAWKQMPQARLWNDPAMRAFKDKFLARGKQEFLDPLQRELGITLDNLRSLARGQITLALTKEGPPQDQLQTAGLLMLVDSKGSAEAIKARIAEFRERWSQAKPSSRTERIRGVEFIVLSLSSNDVPKTLRKLWPPAQPVQELGAEEPPPTAPAKTELWLGQCESLLVIASRARLAERVIARLTGGTPPILNELATYQADHLLLFRESPLYGWVNAKALVDALTAAANSQKDNPEAPNPFDLKPERFLNALGFGGLQSLAFSFQPSKSGPVLQLFIGVPEAKRQGLFRIVAGEPRETAPPAWVPADAMKFRRWRFDGQKTWTAFEKMLNDISPQAVGAVNFLLDSANIVARQKDPGFDVKSSLIGNLGDDIVSYTKAAHGLKNPDAADSVLLIGSAKPEAMATALKNLLAVLPQGDTLKEREFLGRKLYSVPMPSLPLPASKGPARLLSFAPSGGYLAFSFDVSLLEEHLRNSQDPQRSLRAKAGLAEAAERVIGPGATLFGYENQRESIRLAFESARRSGGSPTNDHFSAAAALLPASARVSGLTQVLNGWMDFSLLPPFEQVSNYFNFSVYGGSATGDGLMLKMFAPAPPGASAQE